MANQSTNSSSIRTNLYLLLSLVVIIFIVIFSLQNARGVSIQFLVWKGQISLALVLLIFFAAGLLTSQLFMIKYRFQKQKELSQYKRELKELQQKSHSGRSEQKDQREAQ